MAFKAEYRQVINFFEHKYTTYLYEIFGSRIKEIYDSNKELIDVNSKCNQAIVLQVVKTCIRIRWCGDVLE